MTCTPVDPFFHIDIAFNDRLLSPHSFLTWASSDRHHLCTLICELRSLDLMMRAVILSSALGLLFLVRSSQADCPNPGWGSKPIPETSDVGFIVFTTDNSDGVYSSKAWISLQRQSSFHPLFLLQGVGATGSLVDFLEPFDDGSNIGFRLTRELSSLVDCVGIISNLDFSWN